MVNYKLANSLVAVLVSMVPVVSASGKSGFQVVELARTDGDKGDLHARAGNLSPETYEGGVYKVAYDACQTQLASTAASVSITSLDDRKTLDIENVPPACMTISGALTNNFAEGYPIPMGSDKLQMTGVTEDTINRVQSALEANPSRVGSDVDSNSTTRGGNVTSVALNSTSSGRLPSRYVKRKIAREFAKKRLFSRS